MKTFKTLLLLAALCGFSAMALTACDIDVDDNAGSVSEFVR